MDPLYLIPALLLAVGLFLGACALWNFAPVIPGVRIVRSTLECMGQEIMDEIGPQLQSSTNRNAICMALTAFLALVLPPQWAAMGASWVVALLTVVYLFRTMAGRKRASGPIITPRDLRGDADDIADQMDPGPRPVEQFAAKFSLDAGCQVRVAPGPQAQPAEPPAPPPPPPPVAAPTAPRPPRRVRVNTRSRKTAKKGKAVTRARARKQKAKTRALPAKKRARR